MSYYKKYFHLKVKNVVNKNFVFVITTILDYTYCQYSALNTTTENLLTDKLFKSYQKIARPTDVVYVMIGLRYFQLIDIDEKNGIMKSVSVIVQVWNDPR